VGVSAYQSRPKVGGPNGICSTTGNRVVTRPRLLISILPPVVVVIVLDDDCDADEDDRRDDVTMTSSGLAVPAVFAGLDDVIDSAVGPRLLTRRNCFPAHFQAIVSDKLDRPNRL